MHINYVISLTDAQKRRAHIAKEFGNQNIDFEFYDALSPSDTLNQLIQTHLPNLAQANLTMGERACFMSHYVLWKKCVEQDLPYIFIFEDDILLGKEADAFLQQDLWLEQFGLVEQAFILRFETFLKPAMTKQTPIQPYHNREIKLLLEEHYGTAAYVISHQAIKILMKNWESLESKDFLPLDRMMFYYSLNLTDLNIYQLSPALCVQELQYHQENSTLSSHLEIERAISNKILKEKTTITKWFTKLLQSRTRKKIRKERMKYIINFE